MKDAYAATKTIEASAEKIWALLTNASAYAEWNKSVEKVEGVIAQGERIKVFAKISPDRAFPVTVTELTANQSMTWQGGMPLGLFRGRRSFTLTASGQGQVDFRMEEKFSGLLSPLIVRAMPDLTESFEQFARCLKVAAEA